MVDPKKSIIKYLEEPEAEPVKIELVAESNKTKKIGQKEVALPYRIRIINKNKDIVAENETLPYLTTNNWTKKFFINKKTGYVSFSYDSNLLAILEILRATKNKIVLDSEAAGEFNINNLEGVKFNAVIASYDGGKFIDWVKTFQINGVRVPTKAELGGSEKTTEVKDIDNSKEVESIIDPNDLPF